MLTGDALEAMLPQLPSRPLRNGLFRVVLLRYAGDPLGTKRPINANRFNLPSGARVLYLGDSQMTCLVEAQAVGAPHLGVAIHPVEARLQAVVDLRDHTTQTMLQTTTAELQLNFRLRPNPAATQELGEACAKCGVIDGLLFASAAHQGGLNLAVIEANLAVGALIVRDDGGGVLQQLA